MVFLSTGISPISVVVQNYRRAVYIHYSVDHPIASVPSFAGKLIGTS
jgi:hypothetical protein